MMTAEREAGMQTRRAVFVDRDGVLVEDRGPLVATADIAICEDAPLAMRRLKQAGFALVVVSNQTVVARGLLDLREMLALQTAVEARLEAAGGVAPDAFYFCPHHPRATLPEYRRGCGCRKPAPGLLKTAARTLGLDLGSSFMIGDRPSDVLAGRRAGCRTIQVLSGRHVDPPIEVDGGFEPVTPDWSCGSLGEAAERILRGASA